MSLLDPQPRPTASQVSPEPSSATPAPDQSPTATQSARTRQPVRATRTGRVWVALCAAALIAVALIIFMVQNTGTVAVSFLGTTGHTSLGLMLLIAAVGGILLTLILGSARIVQLRLAVRRRRR